MSYNEKTKQYVYEYKSKNIKRVPLDLQLSDYEELKRAADVSGESVNGYIKAAIRQRMEREGFQAAGTDPVQAVPPGGIGDGCQRLRESC